MSRFEYDGEEGLPYELWQNTISRALGGRRGQEALAGLEEALLALPERKLIESNLAADGQVCAVGAFIAHRRAEAEGVDIQTVIDAMAAGVRCECGHGRDKHHEGGGCSGKGWKSRPCYCREYLPGVEEGWETADAGRDAGLAWSVAYHLAYLNDEKFAAHGEDERFELMLGWVRRALGKETAAS